MKEKKTQTTAVTDIVLNDGLCDKMNFTSAEAFKMLRTKIGLMLPQKLDNAGNLATGHICRIVGMTSALRGEGKSTASINLTYTVAETGKKVCLIEADMRLPSIAKYLHLKERVGLSNLLTGQCSLQEALQSYRTEKGVEFFVMQAGDIPPTPSELLESRNMEIALQRLSEHFDFIVVDLPPMAVVTDALAVSELLDGMLLVVRRNYCDKHSLRDVLYQFKLTQTRLIGMVFNCSDGSGGGRSYRRGGKYGKKYGKSRYGGYGYGYGKNAD